MTAHDHSNAHQLRRFAARVYYECRLRLGTEPACLPVFGAAGDERSVEIRGLVREGPARRRSLTRDWAQRCLSELVADLFEDERVRYGAIAFQAHPLAASADLQMVVVVLDGQTGEAMSFVGPEPSAAPEPPHLLAEPTGARSAIVTTLQELYARKRPRIAVGDSHIWKTWLTRAHAADSHPSGR